MGRGFLPCKCVNATRPVRAHPLGAIQCLVSVHVGSQGLGTPSKYLARAISCNACKLVLLLLSQQKSLHSHSDAPITQQLCLCALQSFLFQNRTASVASEKTTLPSDERPSDERPSQTPAGVSLSQLSQSVVSGLKDMSWTTTILLGITGATAGVASGLLGIGGGTVVTPLLAILTPLSQVTNVTVQQTHRLDRR